MADENVLKFPVKIFGGEPVEVEFHRPARVVEVIAAARGKLLGLPDFDQDILRLTNENGEPLAWNDLAPRSQATVVHLRGE